MGRFHLVRDTAAEKEFDITTYVTLEQVSSEIQENRNGHVIHFASSRMVNLLCYGSHFSNITFIDAKNKYRSLYLLEVF